MLVDELSVEVSMLQWNINRFGFKCKHVHQQHSLFNVLFFLLFHSSSLSYLLISNACCVNILVSFFFSFFSLFLWEWISKKNTKMFFHRNNYLHFSLCSQKCFVSSSSPPARSIVLVCNCNSVFPLKTAIKTFFFSSLLATRDYNKMERIVHSKMVNFPHDFLHIHFKFKCWSSAQQTHSFHSLQCALPRSESRSRSRSRASAEKLWRHAVCEKL